MMDSGSHDATSKSSDAQRRTVSGRRRSLLRRFLFYKVNLPELPALTVRPGKHAPKHSPAFSVSSRRHITIIIGACIALFVVSIGIQVLGSAVLLPKSIYYVRSALLGGAIGWLIGVGTLLTVTAFIRLRTGDSHHCVSCNYEQGPVDDRIARCPECGADWTAPDALRAGRANRPVHRVWFGVPVLLLGLFLGNHVLPFHSGLASVVWRVMPTFMLIGELHPANYSRMDLLAELDSRHLSPDQRERVIERMLYLADRDGHAWDHKWLGRADRMGWLSEEQRERLYDAQFRIELVAPDVVQIGDSMDIRLITQHRTAIERTLRTTVYVGQLHFNGMPRTHARMNRAIALRDLSWSTLLHDRGLKVDTTNGVRRVHLPGGDRERLPEIGEEPHIIWIETGSGDWQPGDYDISLTVWGLLVPRGEEEHDIAWGEDGKPHLPDFVEWSTRIELSGHVRITH